MSPSPRDTNTRILPPMEARQLLDAGREYRPRHLADKSKTAVIPAEKVAALRSAAPAVAAQSEVPDKTWPPMPVAPAVRFQTAVMPVPRSAAHGQVAVPLPVREVVTTALRPRTERPGFLARVRANVGRFSQLGRRP